MMNIHEPCGFATIKFEGFITNFCSSFFLEFRQPKLAAIYNRQRWIKNRNTVYKPNFVATAKTERTDLSR